MKLSLNTDFTKFPRAGSHLSAAAVDRGVAPAGRVELPHDERHLRRRALTLSGGEKILVDLPAPVALAAGDRLLLDDGRQIEIAAAPEQLLEVRARDALHLAELAWHIGNRHLPAAVEPGRLLILRDHVIRTMLEGLGATVAEVVEAFEPLRGAYGAHGSGEHGHPAGAGGHGSHHHHGHDHDHGGRGRDAYGRLPGDPHYGHNHA